MCVVGVKADMLCGVWPRMIALWLWHSSSSKDPNEVTLDLIKASFRVREGFIFMVSLPFPFREIVRGRNLLCKSA